MHLSECPPCPGQPEGLPLGPGDGTGNPTREAIEAYFQAFNSKDAEALLGLLAEEVVHEINEGPTEIGVEAYRRFRAHMAACYDEVISDLVIMTNGPYGAVEFTSTGRYVAQDGSLPPPRGQKYTIRAAAIFEVRGGKISRVTSLYNLRRFVSMVASGGVV